MGASAVECSKSEHEFSKCEWFREVVVGAEFKSGGLVIESIRSGEHEDRQAAAGGDDVFGDLVTGRAGDVTVQDSNVVSVDAQQIQSGVPVACDIGSDRFQS